jgi:hypothetical protein
LAAKELHSVADIFSLLSLYLLRHLHNRKEMSWIRSGALAGSDEERRWRTILLTIGRTLNNERSDATSFKVVSAVASSPCGSSSKKDSIIRFFHGELHLMFSCSERFHAFPCSFPTWFQTLLHFCTGNIIFVQKVTLSVRRGFYLESKFRLSVFVDFSKRKQAGFVPS